MKQKDIVELCITGVLIIVLCVIIMQNIRGKDRRQRFVAPVSVGQPVAKTSRLPVAMSLYMKLKKETDEYQYERDPFMEVPKELLPEEPQGPTFALMGIIEDDNNLTAFINDEIVEVGTVIEGFEVLEITKEKVVISDGQETLELTISDY